MIVVAQEAWVFWLYAISTSLLLFCGVVVLGVLRETRMAVFGGVACVLFGFALTAGGYALMQSPYSAIPMPWLRVMVRVGWVVASIMAPITLFVGVLALNGKVSRVRRALFFWRRGPLSIVLLALIYVLTGCAPVQPTQFDTPQTEGRQQFWDGALYSCSGIVAGMAGIMGLDVSLDVQTVALGACSIYAERVAKALWDSGTVPQHQAPIVPQLPVDPT